MDVIKEGYSDFLGVNYYASKCVKYPDESLTEIIDAKSNLSGKKGDMGAYELMPDFYQYLKIQEQKQMIGIGRSILLEWNIY